MMDGLNAATSKAKEVLEFVGSMMRGSVLSAFPTRFKSPFHFFRLAQRVDAMQASLNLRRRVQRKLNDLSR